jgi:uncharacterized membrane protein YagU involved in acid resistance
MSNVIVPALLASIAAGIPDIFAAAALSRTSPGKILQTISSGILGEASYRRGRTSMALGLALQIAMSFVIALIYTSASSCVPAIHRFPLLSGAVYGVLIFIIMNFVVVPLSRAHPKPQWDYKAVLAMLLVMILFGEVISFIYTAFADGV